MSDAPRVLIVSDDDGVCRGLATGLKSTSPELTILTATDLATSVDQLESGDVDCILAEYEAAAATPAVLQAAREHYPELAVLLLSRDALEGDAGVVVAEVVDFLDRLDDPAAGEAVGDWIANAMVRGPADAARPAVDGSVRRRPRSGVETTHDESAPGDVDRIETADHRRADRLAGRIKRALVGAADPLEIQRAVCETLVAEDDYTFAWIGEYDRGEGQVVPWVTASDVEDWPVSTSFPVGSDRASTIDRALGSRDAQFVADLETTDDAVPWRDTAIAEGCRGCAVVPLVGDEELHGVMGVYATRTLSDAERAALVEIGDAVGHVLHTVALRGRLDQQERTLRRYQRLVETAGDGMYVLDADGHFTTVNNGLVAMTGYEREGLLGEHLSLIVDDGDVAAGERVVAEMIRENESGARAIEMDVYTKAGTVIPCENQIALLPHEDGFAGTVGVLRDVTERKRRERELRRQNERLDAFASIVSHDLRNPLGVAQGYLETARDDIETEGVDDDLETVADALDRMEDIVAEVLAVARQGGAVTDPEPVDLAAVAEDAWSNVATAAATLSVVGARRILADRSQLLRALENLFRNAVEHGGDDVTVEVGLLTERASRPRPGPAEENVAATSEIDWRGREPAESDLNGSTAREPTASGGDSRARGGAGPAVGRPIGFYVADDGRGIPRKIRERAFESSVSTGDAGLGIGLWIVREIAEAHGWETAATESAEGGARFEFRNVATPR